jgi:putative molybdopterin biosynthesis protein
MQNLTYLHDIPFDEAWKRLEEALREAGKWGRLGIEQIALDEHAIGRVLAEPVWAKISSPHYHASAMDGYAVRSSDTKGADPTTPILLKVPTQTQYLDTGDVLPEWADAVIPIENVEPLDEVGNLTTQARSPNTIRIRSAYTPWSNIRSMGEDMIASQLVIPEGHRLRPVDLGAIAASGHASLRVSIRPRVAILPSGSELIPIGQPAKPGEIIEFNSLVLAGQVNSWGGLATRFPISPDNSEIIRKQVEMAAQDFDLILLNAGSSAGSEDYSAKIIDQLGELLVHGVAIRPGHPVILGLIRKTRNTKTETSGHETICVPIIGVPGYPVSAALTSEIFVEPLLAKWLGRQPNNPTMIKATLTRKISSPAGDDDYVRVAVGQVEDRILAAPLARGAGVITSLSRADGIVILPRGSQGLPAGSEVDVRLYCDPEEIKQTIFTIGSHDITLDILAQFLSHHNRRFSSANAGSLGGLLAIKRGEAHLAGSHLLDTDSGEYNLAYIRHYIPEIPVVLMSLVGRQQGLIVAKGNPKNIHGLDDLLRQDVAFVNRQRGAGTRVLLDYHLELIGVNRDNIQGYEREEYTHLAVAAAVAGGRADCGLGIAAAAYALNLDFLPLFAERYDLVIPVVFFDSELLDPLFKVLRDDEFRKVVSSLPGYDISIMGQVVAKLN